MKKDLPRSWFHHCISRCGKACLVLWLVCVARPLPVQAYFQEWGNSAQPAGLGGAGTAGEGGLSFALKNPAALRGLTGWSWLGEYTAFLHGLSDGSSLGESGLRIGTAWDAVVWAGWWQSRGLADLFQEQSGGLTASWPAVWSDTDRMGLTVKWLRISQAPNVYTRANAALQTLEAQAWSWDLGFTGSWSPEGSWALAIRDVGRPIVGLTGEESRVPYTVSMGLGYRLDPAWRWLTDIEWREGLWKLATGTEWTVMPEVVGRWGVSGHLPPGLGVQFSSFHAGGSYQWAAAWGHLRLDYAFVYPLSGWASAWGTHRLAFGVSPLAVPQLPEISSTRSLEQKGGLAPLIGYTRLALPADEWQSLQGEEAAGSPAVRHHRAVLTVLVAGITAGEIAFQGLLGDRPAPSDQLALRAIQHLRYDEGGETLEPLIQAYREATAQPEVPDDGWLTLGFLEAYRHRWPEAAEAYRRWWSHVREGEAAPGGLATMAVVALEVNEISWAESGLAKLLVAVPEDPWVKELQGRVFLARGRPADALTAFQGAERGARDPAERGRALLHQALALARFQREEHFLQALEKISAAAAIWDAPAPAAAQHAVIEEAVRTFWEEGQRNESRLLIQDAAASYQRVLTFAPNHPQAKVQLARVRQRISEQVHSHALRAREAMEAANLEEAAVNWRLVLDADPGNAEAVEAIDTVFPALLLKAQDRINEGQYEDASQLFHTLDKVKPGDPLIQRGRETLRQQFTDQANALEQKEAIAHARERWQAFAKLVPQDEEAKQQVLRLTQLGRERVAALLAESRKAHEQGDIPAALLIVDRAFKVEPEAAEIQRMRVQLQEERTRLLEDRTSRAREALRRDQGAIAKEWYQKVLALQPDHAEALEKIAQLDNLKGKRIVQLYQAALEAEARLNPQEALKTLTALFAASPQHPEGQKLQKTIRDRLHRAEQSKAQIDEDILKGDVAYGEGQLRQALTHYERAAELDYYSLEIRRKIEDLKKELKP